MVDNIASSCGARALQTVDNIDNEHEQRGPSATAAVCCKLAAQEVATTKTQCLLFAGSKG